MSERNLICINCPMGCLLSVVMDDDKVVSVKGHTCNRGEIYAKKEVVNPTRIVTTTVKVSDGSRDMVSVKTLEDIPKRKVFQCVEELRDVVVPAPINIGDVILTNIAGTGVDIVATKCVRNILETH